MTDATTPTPGASDTNEAREAASSATSTVPTDNIDALPEWARKELLDLRKENGDRRIAAKKAEEDQRRAEAERLKEQNDYKTLAERYAAELDALRPLADKASVYEKQAAETLKRRIDALPEHVRGAVPEYDDPLKVIGWLDANAAVLSLPTPPPTDAGVRGAVPAVVATQSQSQVAGIAAQYGYKITAEQVAVRAKQIEQTRRNPKGE